MLSKFERLASARFIQRNFEQIEISTIWHGELCFTITDLREALLHWKFITFVEIAVIIYTIFDFGRISDFLPILLVFLYWNMSAFVAISLYVSVLLFLFLAIRKFKRKRLFLVVVNPIAIPTAIMINRLVLQSISDIPPMHGEELAVYVLRSVIVFFCMELFYFEFVQPIVRLKLLGKKEPLPDKSGIEAFLVADKSITLNSLSYVQSVDHYIVLNFTSGASVMVLGKIGDFVEQSKPSWGVSPHRSYWVASHAISNVTREGRKRFIQLKNGEQIPVSDLKKKEIESWFNEYSTKATA